MCERTEGASAGELRVKIVSATKQDFEGERFYRYDGDKRYFRRPGRQGEQYLHRVVWMQAHGTIPPGAVIHHVDGDRANNQLDNLLLVPSCGEHTAGHWTPERADTQRAILDSVRHLSAAWHGSPEGRAWHRHHGTGTARERRYTHVCLWCGNEYQTARIKQGYCCQQCKTAMRYHAGTDDIERICPVCGKPFRINRYAQTKTCGRECGTAHRRRRKAGGQG